VNGFYKSNWGPFFSLFRTAFGSGYFYELTKFSWPQTGEVLEKLILPPERREF